MPGIKGSPVLAGTGVTCLVICICHFAVLKNFRVIDSRFENITYHIDERDLSVFSPVNVTRLSQNSVN